MWEYTILERDGKEVILVTGDVNAGEKGWVVCEMPLPDIQPLRDEQIARAILMCASPLMVKVLRETKEDIIAELVDSLAVDDAITVWPFTVPTKSNAKIFEWEMSLSLKKRGR